jgi:hypothetical protein
MRASVPAISLIISALGTAVPGHTAAQGVERHGPLVLGGQSPVRAGDPTAQPYKTTPRSKFYILVVAQGLPTMCVDHECGPHGDQVRKLGGWITGDDQRETIAVTGLDEAAVRAGTQKIVVIADHKERIIGIYPGKGPADVRDVLQLHKTILPTRGSR